MAAPEVPALLTVAEVATALRVSKMTIYRQIDAGQLPAVKVRRSFRIPAAAIEKLLADARWGQ